MNSIQIEDIYNDSCMDDNSYEENISIINDIETYAVNDAFYIEYTVDNSCTYALDAYDSTNTYRYGIPRLFTTSTSTYYYNAYSKIEITLLDGTTTTNLSTPCSNVEKVKLWYPETSIRISFYGNSNNETGPVVKTINYVNTTNFTTFYYMFYYCDKLVSVNTSNWDTSNATDFGWMFYGCSSLTSIGDLSNWDTSNVATNISYSDLNTCSTLNKIEMENSNYSSVNQIISTLPTKTTDSMGVLNIAGVDDFSQVDTTTAQSEYWNISPMLIARYTANASGVVPTFNDGYQYTVNETESNGIYTVELYSDTDFTNCSFSGKSKLLTVEYLKVTNNVTDMGGMFNNCSNLTQLDVSNFDTSNVTNMADMFYRCLSLIQLNLSNFNTSNVTDMNDMFYSCNKLTTLNVSNFDTTNVTAMSYMFSNCNNLTTLDLSNFDTSSVTDMKSMFNGCSNLTQLDVSTFNTTNVTNMRSMFYDCQSLTQLDLSNFDTSNVTDMYAMFNNCTKLTSLNVSNFNTSNVASMYNMFRNCSQLTQLDLSNFNTSNVTDMRSMFHSCSQLTQLDVSNFDTSSVTNKTDMFANCSSLIEITTNNVSTSTLSTLVTVLPTRTSDSYGTIYVQNTTDEIISSANAKYWNIDTSMLIAKYTANASGVVPVFNSDYQYTTNETESNGIYTVELRSYTDFTSCSFNGESNLLTVEYLKVTSSVTTMNKMFRYCSQLTQVDVSNFDTSNVTNMASMFNGCSKLTQLDVSNFNTSKVTTMTYMFCDCNKLTQLDVSNWVTSSVTGMNNMFQNCSSLTTIGDTSNWNIGKVQYMNNMFDNCSSFTQLNVNNWNTSNVKETSYMFQKCSSLTQLDLSNWVTSNVTRMDYMFNGCSKLTQLDLSNWVTSNVTTMSYMFQNCSSLTQLDVSTWVMSKVTGVTNMFYDCTSFNNVIATNVSTSTLSTLVTVLPTRTSDSYGAIKATETTDEITSSANAKYWNVKLPMLIARYTTNTSGVVPVFNSDYQYTTNETESNGIYTVELRSYTDFTSCSFNGRTNLLTVEYLKVTNNVTDMSYMFYGCQSLTSLDVSNWDTSNATTMSSMFHNCNNLTELDVSNWDTSNATDMGNMFRGCSQLTQLDVNNWDTSNVQYMYGMFYDCSQLIQLDLTNWDISSVRDVNGMFVNCSSLTQLDVSTWDTSEVTNINSMFYNCSLLTLIDVSTWDTKNVTDISGMFFNCTKLTSIDVSNFDTSKVTDMSNMFRNCDKLALLDVSNFDTSKVTNMESMFTDCSSLEELILTNTNEVTINKLVPLLPTSTLNSVVRLSSFSSSLVTPPSGWRYGLAYLIAEYKFDKTINSDLVPTFNSGYTYIKSDIEEGNIVTRTIESDSLPTLMRFGLRKVSGENYAKDVIPYTSLLQVLEVDVSKVTSFHSMFRGCENLVNLDVSNWNTSNVTVITSMFAKCGSLQQLDISNWDMSKVTDATAFCEDCIKLQQVTFGNFSPTSQFTMDYMFDGCSELYKLDVNEWDVSNATGMGYMFRDCSSLTSLDVSNWNTSSVTYMTNMFRNCSSLTTLDVSNWDISKVTTMESTFYGCESLTTLDTSNWDTSEVTDMYCMFYGCESLTTLDTSNWNTSNVTDMSGMFYDCSSLTTLDVSKWNTSKVTGMNGVFRNCSSLTTLDVSNWDISKVTDIRYTFCNCSSLTTLDVSNWDTSKVTAMRSAFLGCSNLTTLDVSKWNTSKVTDMNGVFRDCSSLTTLDVSNWDISKVTTMAYMFNNCSSLTTLDVSNWDISKVTMRSTFYGCESLTTLDVSNWDTSEVIDMGDLFNGCQALKSLDLSNWDVSNVTNMTGIFNECYVLETLDISNFSMNSVEIMDDMLTKSPLIKDIGMLYCDTDTINKVANGVGHSVTIWVKDTPISELETVSGVTYKEYKEDKRELILNSELLPGDKLVVRNDGIYHYHKMWKEVLDGTYDWSTPSSQANATTELAVFDIPYNKPPKNSRDVICDLIPPRPRDMDIWSSDVTDECCFINWQGTFLMRVKRERTNGSLDQFILENSITIIYELETPYYEKISDNILLDSYNSNTNIETETFIPIKNLVPINYRENVAIKGKTKYRVVFDCDVEGERISVDLGGKLINHITQLHNVLIMDTPDTLSYSQLRIDGYNIKIFNQMITEGTIEVGYFENILSIGEDASMDMNVGDTTIPLQYYNPNTQTYEKVILRKFDEIKMHDNGKYYYHKRTGEITLDNEGNIIIPQIEEEIYECTSLTFPIYEGGATVNLDSGLIPHNIEISLGNGYYMELDHPLGVNDRLYWNSISNRYEISRDGVIEIPDVRGDIITTNRLYRNRDTEIRLLAGGKRPSKAVIEYKNINDN